MVIQRWYCWQKAGQAQRSDYVRVRKAALTLQAVWRGVLARRNARVCGRGGRRGEGVLDGREERRKGVQGGRMVEMEGVGMGEEEG